MRGLSTAESPPKPSFSRCIARAFRAISADSLRRCARCRRSAGRLNCLAHRSTAAWWQPSRPPGRSIAHAAVAALPLTATHRFKRQSLRSSVGLLSGPRLRLGTVQAGLRRISCHGRRGAAPCRRRQSTSRRVPRKACEGSVCNLNDGHGARRGLRPRWIMFRLKPGTSARRRAISAKTPGHVSTSKRR